MPISKIIDGKEIIINDDERTQTEIWSRVMGYYRPIDYWNIGKQQEFRDRKNFNMGLLEKRLK